MHTHTHCWHKKYLVLTIEKNILQIEIWNEINSTCSVTCITENYADCCCNGHMLNWLPTLQCQWFKWTVDKLIIASNETTENWHTH